MWFPKLGLWAVEDNIFNIASQLFEILHAVYFFVNILHLGFRISRMKEDFSLCFNHRASSRPTKRAELQPFREPITHHSDEHLGRNNFPLAAHPSRYFSLSVHLIDLLICPKNLCISSLYSKLQVPILLRLRECTWRCFEWGTNHGKDWNAIQDCFDLFCC